MQNQRGQKTQFDRLMQAVNSKRLSDSTKYLLNNVRFLKEKNFQVVQTTRFLEILFIAKKVPEAFDNDELHTVIYDNGRFPPGLTTTLFISLGRAYELMKKSPPPVMAILLYNDIFDSNEFCNYQPARAYIERVVAFYFFPRERMSLNLRSKLDRYSPPNSHQHSGIIPELKKAIKENIEKPSNDRTLAKKSALMLTFFPMPCVTDKFALYFPLLIEHCKERVPEFFQAAADFLIKCDPNNNDCKNFLEVFTNLKVGEFETEHQEALALIQRRVPEFGVMTVNIEGITGTYINSVILSDDDRENNSLMLTLEDKFKKRHPPFETLITLVDKLINDCESKIRWRTIKFIYVLRTMMLYQRIIKYSTKRYTDGFFMVCATIVDKISKLILELTITNSESKDFNIIEQMYVDILVPSEFRDTGILLGEETVYCLLKIAIENTRLYPFNALHKCLYYVIVHNEKFPNCKCKDLIHDNNSQFFKDIVDDITKLTNFNEFQGIGVLYSYELALVSPSYIGVKLWKENYVKYLISSLDERIDDSFKQFDIMSFKNHNYYDSWITNFSKNKYINVKRVLQLEPYINGIVDSIDPFPPIPLFRTLSFQAITNFNVGIKVMLRRFVAIIYFDGSDEKKLPIEETKLAIDYIQNKVVENNTREMITINIAQYLDHDAECVRKSAFIIISLINTDISGRASFRIPLRKECINYIGNAIIKELDLIMIEQYKLFLEKTEEGRKKLDIFRVKCPLKYHEICGDENNFHTGQISIPDMNCPFYQLDIKKTKEMPDWSELVMKPKVYKDLHEIKETIPLPQIDDNDDDYVMDRKEEKANIETETEKSVADVIYRYLSVLEISSHKDTTRFFAVASLKRLIIKYSDAFEELMTPMIPMLESLFQSQHTLYVEQWDIFEYFLSICALRRRLHRPINESEARIINEHVIPFIKNIDLSRASFPFIEELSYYVINEKSDIAKYIVPKETSIDAIARSTDSNMAKFLQSTIIFEDPDETDERLINFAFNNSVGEYTESVIDEVVIPVIMSASPETVSRFFEICGKSDAVDSIRIKVTNLLVNMKISLERE